jgi:hypothetical protein
VQPTLASRNGVRQRCELHRTNGRSTASRSCFPARWDHSRHDERPMFVITTKVRERPTRSIAFRARLAVRRYESHRSWKLHLDRGVADLGHK